MRPAAAAHPTRTLFVRGLAPSTTEEDLRKFLEVHGEVRKVVTTFIPTKGFSFVTFYDIRHAEVRFFFSFFSCFLLFFVSRCGKTGCAVEKWTRKKTQTLERALLVR
jgi:hypothetical protein